MAEKRFAAVGVRIPSRILSSLDAQRRAEDHRSIAAVIEHRIARVINTTDALELHNFPKGEQRVELSLKTATHRLLRKIAEEYHVELGDVLLSLVAADEAPKPIRIRELSKHYAAVQQAA